MIKMMHQLQFSVWLLASLGSPSIAQSFATIEGGGNESPRLLRQRQAQATLEENNEFLGIPGTTQTINGYDTALGNEAICWKGAAADLVENNYTTTTILTNAEAVDALVKTVFPNPLVENFTLAGETEILKRCPSGNTVTVQKPIESLVGERLRTLRYYDYSLHVEIDLDTLDGDYIVTDDGDAEIALQVVTCSLGKSGFCSPFVHEQANAREAIDKLNRGDEIVTTKKKVKGDLHGGTHIHSPWVFLDLGSNRTLSANVTVPMIVNIPGDYFLIGTIQLYTGINGSDAYRWDISNALDSGDGRYLLYQDPAEISSVSDGVLIFSYVAIATSGAIIVFLFGQTFYHRDHQVLQLSQGTFLLVFLFCALVSTISSFLLAPKNDVYCRISFPIIMIPIQLMYAITVGRLWRIHAVISPLLLEHLSKGNPGLTQRFVQLITFVSFKLVNLFICKKENKRRSTGGAKQQISQSQLTLVVILFTLPQVVIQLVALIAQPSSLVIDFNEDESKGRSTCGAGVSNAESLVLYSFLMLFLLVVILLFMAHSSRKLPSLFNETNVIYDSTFLSMVLLLLGGAVIALTDGPETSPDVEYLVSLVLILSITLNSAVRIIVPKLQKVWANETVIVSKLVTDHHRKAREKQATRGGPAASVHISGIDASDTNRFGQSFSRGDYDHAQANRLLTIHSRSNDLNGRSSANSSENRFQSYESAASESQTMNQESFFMENLEPEADAPKDDGQLAAIKENPSKQAPAPKQRRNGVHARPLSATDQTLATEADVESAGSGSSPNNQTSPNAAADAQHNGGSDAAPGAEQFSNDGASDANHDEETKNAQEKKPTFFDQRAGSFLKSAMAKGLSFKMTTDRSNRSFAKRQKDEALEKSERGDTSEADRNMKSPDGGGAGKKKRLQRKMVVTEDETPARRLVLKMLDLQDQLEAVNNKIMSGLAVSQEDWGVITKLTTKLDRTFAHEVEFEWDIERQYEEKLEELMPEDMSGRNLGAAAPPTKKDEGKSPDVERNTSMKSLASFRSNHNKGILRKPSNGKAAVGDPLLGSKATPSVSMLKTPPTPEGPPPLMKLPPEASSSNAPVGTHRAVTGPSIAVDIGDISEAPTEEEMFFT